MSEEITVNCSSCNGEILSTLDQLGAIVDCPHCKTETVLESAEQPVIQVEYAVSDAPNSPPITKRKPSSNKTPPLSNVGRNPYEMYSGWATACYICAMLMVFIFAFTFGRSILNNTNFNPAGVFNLIFGAVALFFWGGMINMAASSRWILAETLSEVRRMNAKK